MSLVYMLFFVSWAAWVEGKNRINSLRTGLQAFCHLLVQVEEVVQPVSSLIS